MQCGIQSWILEQKKDNITLLNMNQLPDYFQVFEGSSLLLIDISQFLLYNMVSKPFYKLLK